MRRLAISALIFTCALAGLGEMGGHACCRSLVMKAMKAMKQPGCSDLAALPCCPRPCKMRPGNVEFPAVPETFAAQRLLTSARPTVSSAPVSFEHIAPFAIQAAQRPEAVPTRSSRAGLALRSVLLI